MRGEQVLFWLFALTACGGGVSVVLCQSVVRMAVSLIVSLTSVAALFFLLNADFVGATQLMVYVGGTVVLLIFGVMLTASSPFVKIRTSPGEGFLSAGVGVLFLALVAFTIGSLDWNETVDRVSGGPSLTQSKGHNPAEDGNTTRPLALSFIGLRPDSPGAPGYLLPFEIVSVHLLVVMVGAAYLARSKRSRRGGPQEVAN